MSDCTIEDLFPEAPSHRAREVLELHEPPRFGQLNARLYHRVLRGASWLLFPLWASLFVVPDGPASERLAVTCFVAWAFVRIGRRVLRFDVARRVGRRSRRISWSGYARDRGLDWVAGAPGHQILSDMREPGTSFPWSPGVATGRLAPHHRVSVGAARWLTMQKYSPFRSHRMLFVAVRLPPEVAQVFPATSVSHFGRFVGNVDLDLDDGRELRLESTTVERTHCIKVEGADPDDLRWRALFDPVLLDAIQTRDVEWHQRGGLLLLVTGSLRIGTVPVQTIDTLCDHASFIASRFLAAAVYETEERLPAAGAADQPS